MEEGRRAAEKYLIRMTETNHTEEEPTRPAEEPRGIMTRPFYVACLAVSAVFFGIAATLFTLSALKVISIPMTLWLAPLWVTTLWLVMEVVMTTSSVKIDESGTG